MRDFLTSSGRRLRAGWFWPLALLTLPNCVFQVNGLGPLPTLNAGPPPHGDAVMCDIEKYQGAQRRCATAQDLAMGISLSSAAEALVTGQRGNVGLDYSAAAFAHCGMGNPEAIDFEGPFPDGYPTCINCGAVMPAPYADATAVCVAECQDKVAAYPAAAPLPPNTLAFCTAQAHASTNFLAIGCFTGQCTDSGTLRSDFVDPRRTPEAVQWIDLVGTMAAGNSLTRTAPATGMFDAGAASMQTIAKGDAYVEFEASESNKSHVLGLSLGAADTDPSIADIGFAISLNADGRFYVLEGGSLIMGPDINGSFGTYTVGQRFRVKLTDNHDGTAAVTYARVNGPCTPGNPCPDTVFYTHAGAPTMYPLRVDASFREQPATLANVTIVRIQ